MDSRTSKSEVSRICAELDVEVAAFRDRSLGEQPFRYVFLDATAAKPESTTGSCPKPSSWPPESPPTAPGVLGFDVGDSEDGAFWTQFLRGLKTQFGLINLDGAFIAPRPNRPWRSPNTAGEARR